MSKPFKVRDFRNKHFFILDDVYLNGYAKFLGPHASCVYFSLCRHADKEQSAFPSEELIGKEFNMSVRTVRAKIKMLREYNLIRTVRERSNKGTWKHNTYYLIDKSEWVKPQAVDASGHPQATEDINQRQITAHIQRQQVPPKDIHVEGNPYKDTLEYKKQRKLINRIRTKILNKP